MSLNLIDTLRVTNGNGVRIRQDDQGDVWAKEHRDELGNQFYMEDLDGFIGTFGFARNGQDTLFAEYQPDGYTNRLKEIRRFALVALFDRKQTRDTALNDKSILTRAFYLWQCRVHAQAQPIAPKFFYVIGKQSPWNLIELDINTAQVIHQYKLERGNWVEIWNLSGLVAARRELEKWLKDC